MFTEKDVVLFAGVVIFIMGVFLGWIMRDMAGPDD